MVVKVPACDGVRRHDDLDLAVDFDDSGYGSMDGRSTMVSGFVEFAHLA